MSCIPVCIRFYNELMGCLFSRFQNCVERGSEGLQAVKELARRLNLSFGLDLIKIRESMVAFHSEGIQFCVSRAASTAAATGQTPGVPSNLLFLEVVAEFSNKLLRQDKKSIYEYLRRVSFKSCFVTQLCQVFLVAKMMMMCVKLRFIMIDY